MTTPELELLHAGPVEYFKIDLSSGPGLYELNGTKGCGKTTVLKSLDLLAGRKKVEITVTDGELSGEVRGFGVMAPIGGQRRRKGEIDVDTIDTDAFSITDLVDPPFKDVVARDKHRIKAIICLRNVIAEPADFYDLVGGQKPLEALLPADKLETDDPVVLASRVKDALESKARAAEAARDHEIGHATACRENPEQIDTTRQSDSRLLQGKYDTAKERQLSLRQSAETFDADATRRTEAREALARSQSAYDGPTVDGARATLADAAMRVGHSTNIIAALEKQLADCKSYHVTLEAEHKAATDALSAATSHQETCKAWKATIEATPLVKPDPEAVTKANTDLQTAKEALEYGVRVRKLLDDLGRATSHQEAADAADKLAKRYRELAAQTMDVLTKLVEAPGVRIESVEGHPRFVVDHPKRGKTLFDNLSDGERVRYSIDATLVKLQGPAMASIPQRIYQDLPPADRQEVAGIRPAETDLYFRRPGYRR